mgnify:CR=1 FL=1
MNFVARMPPTPILGELFIKKMNKDTFKKAIKAFLWGAGLSLVVLPVFSLATYVYFDGDLLPALDSAYKLGSNTLSWTDVNGQLIINSDHNVGLGGLSPSTGASYPSYLATSGGLRLNTSLAKPTCDAVQGGTLWYTLSGAGVKDAVEICAKDASSSYAWRTIY